MIKYMVDDTMVILRVYVTRKGVLAAGPTVVTAAPKWRCSV